MKQSVLQQVDSAMHELLFHSVEAGKYIDARYRLAKPGQDVEHIVAFEVWGSPKHISADFGFRYEPAESFAVECIKKYGGPAYELMGFDVPFVCAIKFPFGPIANWDERSSLVLTRLNLPQLNERLVSDFRRHLLPITKSVLSARDLFGVLAHDEEPFRWHFANPAIRAAQVIFLAQKFNVPKNDLIGKLMPFVIRIGRQIAKDVEPWVYLNSVMSDAKVHGASDSSIG